MSHNQYLPGYKQISHHEWRTAENSAAFLLPTIKSQYAANPKLKLLDVGTGPGTIARDFAKLIPNGHVTATDLSEEVLAKAEKLGQEDKLSNISWQKADVWALPFEDETFDIVHTHQMLIHLIKPVEALKEMLRVTKKGGVVAAKDGDLEMWSFYPLTPGLKRFHQVLLETHERNGSSAVAGRQLVSWALQAGVKRDQIKAGFSCWSYSDEADRQMWGQSMADRIKHGQMRQKAVEFGIMKDEEAEGMYNAWIEWKNSDEGTMGMMNGEILAFK